MFIQNIYIRSIIIMIFFVTIGCKKFIAVDPPKSQLTGATVFEDDATATSAMTGIYNRMFNSSGFVSGSVSSVSFLVGLSSDEFLNYYTGEPDQFYRCDILPDNLTLYYSFWNEAYQYIYTANAILEGIGRSANLSASVKKQLEGEAKFVRAFCYFYLVNLWGDIPLARTTNYQTNNLLSRSPASVVYQFIEDDLASASELMITNYIDGNNAVSSERVRPNAFAASALLARVYLYEEKWGKAIEASNRVINQTGLYSLSTLQNVFLKNSSEAIWQLYPTSAYINSWDGYIYIVQEGSSPYSAGLSEQLLSSFEANDRREVEWVGSLKTNGISYNFPYKYKVGIDATVSEYSMILRLSEQYLIRAEAKVHVGDILGGISDLNTIRQRAGVANVPDSKTAPEVLSAIIHERQVELFSEWGHRWLDLKRTGLADQILSSVKPSTFNHNDLFYPIPHSDILANSNLEQNPGY